MDFKKLTIKSQEAVGAAGELARRRGNPEVYPEHLLLALLDQELPRTLVERAGSSVDGLRQAAEATIASKPSIAGRPAAAPRLGGVRGGARPGGGRDASARRRVRLDRASPPRPRRRPARRAPRGPPAGAGLAARHLAGSRGLVSGAREVRHGPDRARRGGQARPRHRPRRGDPSRDPGALPANEEQPGADRRAGSGEDRHRRGARRTHRRRRRPGRTEGQARLGARHRRAARRLEVPGRVRGAPEGGPPGDPELRGGDHPLHRRAAHDRRRRRRRGSRRRGQHAEADARPRRASRGRCDDARRVPQAHREGRGARAALPARAGRRALRRRHDRHPARPQGALRGTPRRPHSRRRARRRRRALGSLHRRPLPARQGDRPGRRGRVAPADGDRLLAARARRGGPPRPPARDRAGGDGEGVRGRPRARRAGAGRGAGAPERARRPLGGREGGARPDQGDHATDRRAQDRGRAR